MTQLSLPEKVFQFREYKKSIIDDNPPSATHFHQTWESGREVRRRGFHWKAIGN